MGNNITSRINYFNYYTRRNSSATRSRLRGPITGSGKLVCVQNFSDQKGQLVAPGKGKSVHTHKPSGIHGRRAGNRKWHHLRLCVLSGINYSCLQLAITSVRKRVSGRKEGEKKNCTVHLPRRKGKKAKLWNDLAHRKKRFVVRHEVGRGTY
ncbi:hypothetical protein CDAR_414301 [Caerostris darwini]|uniref:Uncharacterized protein n=1 Tax=Caerostris darwini TaxID=1538125 RepID=A0AAV4RE91_9ARAC|nr:hypothetical protein CDAR_414301 [Caerostris darwini]